MEEENQLPFGEVLGLLFSSKVIPIQHLYRLSDMDEVQTSAFIQRWSTAEDARRLEIARHLADLSENNFFVDFSPLFSFMLHDAISPIRVAALDGLWDCEDENLVDPIIDLMHDDPTLEVKSAAARSLAHFVMMAEWDQISGKKVPAIFKALREIYEDPETPVPLKGAALEAMAPLAHPKIREFIEESFEGYSPELQRSALFAMGISADPLWLPILIDEMENPDVELRAEAARAAGSIGAADAVSQLSELAYDKDEDVVRAAIEALGQISDERAIRVLEELLSDEALSHLQETVEEALEESVLVEGELPLHPWSDGDFKDGSD